MFKVIIIIHCKNDNKHIRTFRTFFSQAGILQESLQKEWSWASVLLNPLASLSFSTTFFYKSFIYQKQFFFH